MSLAGKRVAILAENNYQELELWYPLLRLREAGADATTLILSMMKWRHRHGQRGYLHHSLSYAGLLPKSIN